MQIKDKGKQSKLSNTPHCYIDNYLGFSFKYLTTNNKYNFNFLSDKNNRLETYDCLMERLCELSKRTWLELSQLDKTHGFETFDYSEIGFQASEDARLNKDSKVYIIRYASTLIKDHRKAEL